MNRQTSIGLKGQIKVAVIDHRGRTILERGWQPNLILDQGLNQLAETVIADLFAYCAKGTWTTTPTKESVSGSYTLAAGTVTRVSGSRDFTADDVGRLIRSADSKEVIVTAYTDATHVDVRAVGTASLPTWTTQSITIYYVEQVGLVVESGARTNTYSAVSGDNSTTDGTGSTANQRTLKRTFIFDPEPENKETVTGSYTWSSTTVTRDSGSRDFTAADEGKYIKFDSTHYAIISNYTDATHVDVDRSGSASGSIEIYGFNTYGEIGFSHSDVAGDNLNVRVRLEDGGGSSDPVTLLGDNPETPGQQLKITYQLQVTVSPSSPQSGTANIDDDGNDMSSNKVGHYAVEWLATSKVSTDGSTDISFAGLEPSIAGAMALSPVTTALVTNLASPPERGAGAESVAMENLDYTADSFKQVSQGTFGINDAIGTSWRGMGIFDDDSSELLFTFLFNTNQVKDGDHSLTRRFAKTWNRDLS